TNWLRIMVSLASSRSFAVRMQFSLDGHGGPSRDEPYWRARPFTFRMFWPIRDLGKARIKFAVVCAAAFEVRSCARGGGSVFLCSHARRKSLLAKRKST